MALLIYVQMFALVVSQFRKVQAKLDDERELCYITSTLGIVLHFVAASNKKK